MTEHLDEKELKELLKLASIAEQKMQESSQGLTDLAKKWQDKAKAQLQNSQQQG